MPVVVLDTETSGACTPQGKASVIEVGAVVLTENGEELGSFSCFVKPLHPLGSWSYHAMRVNQIDPVLLDRAPLAPAVWSALLDWMALHKPITAVLAFNLPFDQAAMAKSFPDSSLLPWGPCLMRSASEVLSGTRASIKLVTAAKALGIPVDDTDTHRALYDARLAGKVYRALL